MDIVCLYIHIFDCMHVLYVFMCVFVRLNVRVCKYACTCRYVGRRMNGIMFKDVIPFSMNTREQP